MKVSGRIVSIMLAAVVVLFAFLLVSSVGKRRDGFQERAKQNVMLGGANTSGSTVAKKDEKKEAKKDEKKEAKKDEKKEEKKDDKKAGK